MYKHILIAVDGSDIGQKGLEQGLALAKALGARVTVVTVSELFPFAATNGAFAYVWSETAIADYSAGQEETAKGILKAAAQTAERIGVTIDVLHVADAPPAEAIVQTAKSRNCDLITMGSHGRRGLGRLMLGSKASEVAASSQVPVLVVR